MSTPWYAALDLGSHSTILLLARHASSGSGLTEEREYFRVTRLGEGLGTGGHLAAPAMERALACVSDFLARLPRDGQPGQGVAVATSAVRSAANGAAFLDACAERLGRRPVLLSGEEEALAVFRGATSDQPHGTFCLCVDAGGGSTEFATGTAGHGGCELRMSIDIGCARLAERFALLDGAAPAPVAACRAAIVAALAPLWPRLAAVRPADVPLRVVASGGTATTLAALALALPAFDRSRVHGLALAAGTAGAWAARLLPLPAAARARQPGLPAERAPVLPAGLLILDEVLRGCAAAGCVVTTRGLRFGLVLGLAAAQYTPTWHWPPGDAP